MALITPGPMTAEARGSVGGVVFSRNTHGAYTRNRTKPVKSLTQRAEDSRQRVEALQQVWRETLTHDQRVAWENYAKGSPTLNRLGFGTILSGPNVYIRTNSLYIQAGGSRIDTAPPTNGVAALPFITYTGSTVTGLRVITVNPALAAGDAILFFISPAKSNSVNYFNGPFVKTVFNLGVITLPFMLTPSAFLTAGQRYFIAARSVFADGRPSERFQQTIDVV